MSKKVQYSTALLGLLVYVAVPLSIYAFGDIPRRTVLKESISILFVISFSLMLGLFFLSRSNKQLIHDIRMKRIISIHKFIGYKVAVVFLLHPILVVAPRYLEASVDPMDAFMEILTTFDNTGLILGITSWVLMLLLGVTSFIRNRLPFKYTTWHLFHGITVMLFIATSTWHVLTLGRHMDLVMSVYVLIIALLSILTLTRTYRTQSA